MSADNLPRRLLRFMRRNRRRNADWWADEWCREATELDALARRMDAVRAYCASSLAASDPADGPRIAAQRDVWHHVITLLDGEAGDE